MLPVVSLRANMDTYHWCVVTASLDGVTGSLPCMLGKDECLLGAFVIFQQQVSLCLHSYIHHWCWGGNILGKPGSRFNIWVRWRNCGCLVTWFCYQLSISWLLMSWRRKEPGHQQPWYWQLIAEPGNKTAAVSWPDPYRLSFQVWTVMRLSYPYNRNPYTTSLYWGGPQVYTMPANA